MRYRIFIVLVVLVIASACGTNPTDTNGPANVAATDATAPPTSNQNLPPVSSSAEPTPKKQGHEHTSPHSGTLIAFGKEFAHLEIVIEASSRGQITAYALDGEAENPVKIAQESIVIEVEKPTKFSISLDAVENSLTGEKRGATSEFRAQAEQLKELQEFDGVVRSLTIRGKKFDNVKFNFPKGNEGDHRH